MKNKVANKIKSYLQQRDDAYEVFAKKTEDLFYQRYVANHPEWAAVWETRSEFNIADVCIGMNITSYIELAFSQQRDPSWLAKQLLMDVIDFEKERAYA